MRFIYPLLSVILLIVILVVPVIITVLLLRHFGKGKVDNGDYLLEKIRELEKRIEALEGKEY